MAMLNSQMVRAIEAKQLLKYPDFLYDYLWFIMIYHDLALKRGSPAERRIEGMTQNSLFFC